MYRGEKVFRGGGILIRMGGWFCAAAMRIHTTGPSRVRAGIPPPPLSPPSLTRRRLKVQVAGGAVRVALPAGDGQGGDAQQGQQVVGQLLRTGEGEAGLGFSSQRGGGLGLGFITEGGGSRLALAHVRHSSACRSEANCGLKPLSYDCRAVPLSLLPPPDLPLSPLPPCAPACPGRWCGQ